jgi:hypothetical protein
MAIWPDSGEQLVMKMPIRRPVLRALLLLLPLVVTAVHGDEPLSKADLVGALQRGGYVILMRHASSPGTTPDAAHANADNPRLERQLDEQGQTSARAMGDASFALTRSIGHPLWRT